jgi:hypothetical protein
MKRILSVVALLAIATAAGAQTRAPAPQAKPGGTLEPAPTSALDGEWRGKSDGGSCNAPLDYVLTIEYGFVDGSAYDTTAQGPVPNQRHGPPPAPTPGLWQIHGVARDTGTFSLISVASVKGTDRREGKLTARSDGGGLVVSETGGCRRTARLSRS